MRVLRAFFAVALLAVAVRPAQAQTHYDFSVLYNGGGNAVLAGGSDDPLATTMMPGDDFFWTIAAQGGSFWSVSSGGNFFPFMAFAVEEQGDRIGQFSLALRLGGVDQFTYANTEKNQFIHLGTNTIFLPTGLTWDTMFLSYLILDSSDNSQIDNPDAPEIGSSPYTLLPIFGPPEGSGGIEYLEGQGDHDVVPEPATMTLLATGLAGMATARRKRRKA